MNKQNISISVIVTSWQIARLTRLCLYTIALQNYPKEKYEIIFIDDGSRNENNVMEVPSYFKIWKSIFPTENIFWNLENKGWTMKSSVKDIKSKFPDLNLKYYYRKKKELNWENPAYVWNKAIKKATGEILVQISSDHILLKDNVLHNLVKPHYETDDLYITPRLVTLGRTILDYVDKEGISFENINKYYDAAKKYPSFAKDIFRDEYSWCCNSPDGTLPYIYSIQTKHVLEIGGYDEGFLGRASVDTTFMERLKRKGIKFGKINEECACIPHEWDEGGPHRLLKTREDFFKEQKESENILLTLSKCDTANKGKQWGSLDDIIEESI